MAAEPSINATDSLLSPADILACLRGRTPTGTVSTDFSFSKAVEAADEFASSSDVRKLEPKRLQLPKSSSEAKLTPGLFTDSLFPTEPPKTIFKDVRKGILIRRRDRSSLSGAEGYQRHVSVQFFTENRTDAVPSRSTDLRTQSIIKASQERLLTETEGSQEPKKGKKVTFMLKQEGPEVVPKFDLQKLESVRRLNLRLGTTESDGKLASRLRGERLNIEPFRLTMTGAIGRESTPTNSGIESPMKVKTPEVKSILKESGSSSQEAKTSTMFFAEKVVNKLNIMKTNPESPQGESVVKKAFFPKVPTFTPLGKKFSSEMIFPTSPDKVVKGLAFKRDDIILRQETPVKPRASLTSPSSIEIVGERKIIKQYAFNVDPHKKKDESGAPETEGKLRRSFRQTSLIIRNLKDESLQKAFDSKDDLKRKVISPMKAQHNIDILVPSINIL